MILKIPSEDDWGSPRGGGPTCPFLATTWAFVQRVLWNITQSNWRGEDSAQNWCSGCTRSLTYPGHHNGGMTTDSFVCLCISMRCCLIYLFTLTVTFDRTSFQILAVETLVAGERSLIACGVLCWSPHCTPHTLNNKNLSLFVVLRGVFCIFKSFERVPGFTCPAVGASVDRICPWRCPWAGWWPTARRSPRWRPGSASRPGPCRWASHSSPGTPQSQTARTRWRGSGWSRCLDGEEKREGGQKWLFQLGFSSKRCNCAGHLKMTQRCLHTAQLKQWCCDTV